MGRFTTPSKAAASMPFHLLGSPVRAKASLFLLLSAALTAAAQSVQTKALTTTDIFVWLTGGFLNSRVAQLVKERGLENLPTHAELAAVKAVGGDKELL